MAMATRIQPAPPPSAKHPRRFYVCDGRTALGVVKVIAGTFVAVDADGIEIGTFTSLREASRALPIMSHAENA
jgi:hypothetical protein